MDNSKKGCGCSISLTSTSIIVGIVFVFLKIFNIITWEWVYVLIPFYVAGGFIVLSLLITLIAIIVIVIVNSKFL
jgi:hypothetical protein